MGGQAELSSPPISENFSLNYIVPNQVPSPCHASVLAHFRARPLYRLYPWCPSPSDFLCLVIILTSGPKRSLTPTTTRARSMVEKISSRESGSGSCDAMTEQLNLDKCYGH